MEHGMVCKHILAVVWSPGQYSCYGYIVFLLLPALLYVYDNDRPSDRRELHFMHSTIPWFGWLQVSIGHFGRFPFMLANTCWPAALDLQPNMNHYVISSGSLRLYSI